MGGPVLDLKSNLKPGDLVDNRYQVVEKLGEGGCGSVYRCTRIGSSAEQVAVKLLENPNDLQRFHREIEVLRGTKSPFVVGYRHAGKHLQFPYLAMEYLPGGSLRDHLEKKKDHRIPTKEAAWIIALAIRGLRAASTVHRDLKPENLLITKAAGNRVEFIPGDLKRSSLVKLADFGLAMTWDPLKSRLTNTGQIMGTPLYMSPEQCRNTRDVTEKADIYSLGIILFELVTGDCPHNADDPYTLIKLHNEAEPRYPRGMDAGLQAVIQKCLMKRPEERFRSLASLERELLKVAGVRPAADQPGEGNPELVKWTAAICGLLLLLTVSWLWSGAVIDAVTGWWNPPPAAQAHPHR